MATEKWWECSQCGNKIGARAMHYEFSRITKNDKPLCSKCKCSMDLIVKPQFALGAGSPEFIIQDISELALAPWDHDDMKVSFDPKIILMKDKESGELWIWTPYWHIVKQKNKTPKTKYGQWAPMMAFGDFERLFEKIKQKQ